MPWWLAPHQHTSHLQKSSLTCTSAWPVFLSCGPQLCERFQGGVQKLLRKIRLLSAGLNSLHRNSSSTGIFFYSSSNWQSLKDIILGEKSLKSLIWFLFCDCFSYQWLYDYALKQINRPEGHLLTFQYLPYSIAMAFISDLLTGAET